MQRCSNCYVVAPCDSKDCIVASSLYTNARFATLRHHSHSLCGILVYMYIYITYLQRAQNSFVIVSF